MDRIWAPWRFKYLTAGDPPASSSGSIFAGFAESQDDRTNGIIYRGKHSFALLNAFPYAGGHLMVVPYRLTGDIAELNDEELLEINQLVKRCTIWLRKAYSPQGFNIGVNMGMAAGAGIPNHIHWHIVPRWGGDTNFMTVVGETRVLPQSLGETYDLLRSISDGEIVET